MNYSDIEKYYGSPSAAAKAIGASRQRVNVWKKSGEVPLGVQLDYEIVTKGALKANLPNYFRKQAA